MDLLDKVVVITGAARGLGAAIAWQIAAKGGKLALVDLDEKNLKDIRAQCAKLGVTARVYATDVADEHQVVALYNRVAEEFGRLDVSINNAGILRDGLLVKAKESDVTDKLSLEQWQAVIDVNLTGVFLCGREAAAQMIRCGQG
ncbi:MAG: SDR family NAD(P)-dependent oxidoreductase, partial [Gammaproteobacteria bacterium]